jgi:hypothetical protein
LFHILQQKHTTRLKDVIHPTFCQENEIEYKSDDGRWTTDDKMAFLTGIRHQMSHPPNALKNQKCLIWGKYVSLLTTLVSLPYALR